MKDALKILSKKKLGILIVQNKLKKTMERSSNIKLNRVQAAAYFQAVHQNSFRMRNHYVWKGPYDLSNVYYNEGVSAITDGLIEIHLQRSKEKVEV